MYKVLLAISIAAVSVMGAGFTNSASAGRENAGRGNVVTHVSVTNTLGTGRATTVDRTSTSTGATISNDIQIGLSDGCGQSRVNNNVSHPGSIGASTSINVDLCNPAAGRTRTIRRN
jgi:hypothetical protein